MQISENVLRVGVVASAFAAIAAFSQPASAVTYGFDCITNNLAGDCAILEAQAQVDVTDPGGSQVKFTFTNDVGEASSITDIYISDGNYFDSIASIMGTPGVSFSEGAAPPNPPGSAGLDKTWFITADSDSPMLTANGIDAADENLMVFVNLLPLVTFSDVISALNTGDIRVAVHVQAFDSGGSETGVTTAIPLPASLPLFLAALAGFGILTRRRRAA